MLLALRLREAARLGAAVELVLEAGGKTIGFGRIEEDCDQNASLYLAFFEDLAALQDQTRTEVTPDGAGVVTAIMRRSR